MTRSKIGDVDAVAVLETAYLDAVDPGDRRCFRFLSC